jgi:predicted DNA-binding protein
MKRTNIYLDEGELEALRLLGRRQGRAVAELVREAVDAYLEEHGVRRLGEDEWAARLGALLGRRRKLAAESGWQAAGLDRDVAQAVADVRRGRAARRR